MREAKPLWNVKKLMRCLGVSQSPPAVLVRIRTEVRRQESPSATSTAEGQWMQLLGEVDPDL